MRKVISFLKPYRIPIGIAWFLMLTELFVELWQPLLMAKIIDDGVMVKDLNIVLKWGGIMLGLSLISFTAGMINSFYAAHVSQSAGFDIRRGLYEKVQSFSFANLNLFPTSSLITRLTNDVTQIQNTVFMALRIMMRAPLLVIGGMVMALIVNVKLAFFFTIVMPALLVFLLWILKKGGTLFKTVQEKLDGVNKVMRENLTGMRLVKAFLRKNYEIKRFKQANENLRDQTIFALRIMELTQPVLLLLMNFSIIGVLWFGSIEVRTGNVGVGEVVAIVNYATRITAAFSILSWIIMAFSRFRASATRITEVLETDIDLLDTKEMDPALQVASGKIQFDHVSFTYPGHQNPVLEDISFVAKSGQTVAILGATGSGKSSLFHLIPRLYDANDGHIYIDDIPIQQLKLEHLRNQIGFVSQEVLLFSGTIKDNIAWGKDHANIEEIMEAAQDAQIHETIDKLPLKYDTVLGQKGVNLSGGQKQRMSIARALIRKPKILLLDDSTSALDLKTEAKLLEAIQRYECTTLIITQKVSTAINADHILLLEDGKLLAEGDHETLLQTSGLYQQIVQSQFGKESDLHVQRAL